MERPTDPATLTEFANLLMKIAPDSQLFCVSALGDEVPFTTLNLEVTKDFSLRALVDCGASNNFVRCHLLEDRRHKFVERAYSSYDVDGAPRNRRIYSRDETCSGISLHVRRFAVQ